MKKFMALLVLLSLSSCKLFKNVSKNDTKAKEEILVKSTRVGDTVTYYVPNIKYRDTTIYTTNHVGTRIETRYDDQGNIDLINCFSSTIDELRAEIRELHSKEKDKDEKVAPDKTFWFLLILAVVVGLGILKKI